MKLLTALLIVLLIYAVQSKLYRKYWDKGLSVSLHFSEAEARIGDTVFLTEVVENDKALPMPIIHVKFRTSRTFTFADADNAQVSDYYYRNDMYSVLGRQRITRTLSFTVNERGYFTVDSLQLTSKDLFLTRNFAASFKNSAALCVFPKLLSLKDIDANNKRLFGELIKTQMSDEDPFVFRGIRPYQNYDKMSDINWKASARMQTLMTNMHQPTTSKEVWIILNLKPFGKAYANVLMEHSISIAYTLATALSDAGIRTGFRTNGRDIITKEQPELACGLGNDHKLAFARMLARINPALDAVEMLPILKDVLAGQTENVTCIFISNYRDEALYACFDEARTNGDIYWIIPEFSLTNLRLDRPNMMRWDIE